MALYANRWDLVNQIQSPACGDITLENQISLGLRLIETIRTTAKFVICSKISP